ncbi:MULTISPECIES: hypothetical protein [Acinetobacter]|uniref:AbiJ-NTD3 domain-containing protein n=1 Tax=Acinetobacter junii TaxID=40215 RepID=A0A365PHS0_ACIJU|nr:MULTISPECIES: hypothetical protein [Acinetobacter]RBA35429.1 hypothetical protein DDF86_09120 [Acinetobacter junii]RBA38388.1 hypothetical protein DDG62_14310 [Acinetobacter junii]RBA46438.1 hypothetical protein DC346_10600 [Acinetobacter junii]WLF71166.1 hypothetical protein Q4617_08665 [Acinetobacter junii]
MNISAVIQETSKYLSKYNHIFKPENEIISFLDSRSDFLTSINVKREVDRIYREGNSLFMSKSWLYTSDIENILGMINPKTCIEFCITYSNKIDDPTLFNKISFYYDDKLPPIRSKTRKKIANILPIDVFGKENASKELSKIFLTEDIKDQRFSSIDELFDTLNIFEASTATFRKLLKNIANSNLRDESENRILIAKINDVLQKDGMILVLDESKNYPFFKIKEQEYKPNKAPDYLIFGAIGTKPNIGISDALDGTVSVISDDGDPLTYDRKIIDHLNWSDMEDWWDEINIYPNLKLRTRLNNCLDSKAEEIFFKSYFSLFQEKLGEKLPALIPQVYIAYDPMRAKDLEGGKTRIRQRIDFLMILPNLKRVIIEIDGKHHYAREDGRADTKRYAEMVKVDRDLRLRGYEVYRFGGAEFYNDQNTPEDNAVSVVKDFFTALFKQHEIL